MVPPVESILGVPVISLFCGELSLSRVIKGGGKQFFLFSFVSQEERFWKQSIGPAECVQAHVQTKHWGWTLITRELRL